MKKIMFALWLGCTSVAMTSCKDNEKDPRPASESVPNITSLTATSTISQADARNAAINPTVSFTVNVTGPSIDRVEAIEVYKSFRGIVANTQGQNVLSTLPRVLVRTIPPVQTTIDITLNDLVANMQRRGTAAGASITAPLSPLTRASLTAGATGTPLANLRESFIFTYEILMKDGRRIILTPTSGGVVSGAQTSAPFAAIVTIGS